MGRCGDDPLPLLPPLRLAVAASRLGRRRVSLAYGMQAMSSVRHMRHGMTRYTFEEVRYPASKTVKCVGCGKSIKRSTTFTATVNPWNVNESGDPASYAEVREKLRQKATVWITEPAECTDCIRVRLRGAIR